MHDRDLAAFAASLELAAVALYEAMAARLTPPASTLAALFASHHADHAAAFNAAAGPRAVRGPNPELMAALGPQLTTATDEVAALTVAYGLENKAAASHLNALDSLATVSLIRLTASVLPVEAQHAVVLGALLGKGPKDAIPLSFQTKDEFIDPSLFADTGTGH